MDLLENGWTTTLPWSSGIKTSVLEVYVVMRGEGRLAGILLRPTTVYLCPPQLISPSFKLHMARRSLRNCAVTAFSLKLVHVYWAMPRATLYTLCISLVNVQRIHDACECCGCVRCTLIGLCLPESKDTSCQHYKSRSNDWRTRRLLSRKPEAALSRRAMAHNQEDGELLFISLIYT